MRLVLGSVILFSLFAFSPVFPQHQSVLDDGIFVFVQTVVRNSDGVLIAYLESSKFSDLDIPALHSFLDFESSKGSAAISIGGETYQVIRRSHEQTFSNHDVIASTDVYDAFDGRQVHLVRFAHDGYPVSRGDTLESIFTFIRPL